jgi:radical SAM superfamily enzyme with C-terminal helix-hairpin-helix motif
MAHRIFLVILVLLLAVCSVPVRGGEGVPPLRVAGILPAVRGQDALATNDKARMASPREPTYLTIDDLRLVRYVESVPKVTIDPPAGRTHIEVLNHTREYDEIKRVLANTEELVIVVGVQTPGKYLSARPGTLHEVNKLLSPFPVRKILTGPVLTGGTQFRGGAQPQLPEAGDFDELHPLVFDSYEDLLPNALEGARLITQMPRLANRIVEIETGEAARARKAVLRTGRSSSRSCGAGPSLSSRK